jgi:hypothetical protein
VAVTTRSESGDGTVSDKGCKDTMTAVLEPSAAAAPLLARLPDVVHGYDGPHVGPSADAFRAFRETCEFPRHRPQRHPAEVPAPARRHRHAAAAREGPRHRPEGRPSGLRSTRKVATDGRQGALDDRHFHRHEELNGASVTPPGLLQSYGDEATSPFKGEIASRRKYGIGPDREPKFKAGAGERHRKANGRASQTETN